MKKIHIEYMAVFFGTFIATSVGIYALSTIEFTDALWQFLLLKSLIVVGFWFVIRRKHAIAGHLPLIVGVYLFIFGGGMFVGSLHYDTTNQYGEQIKFEQLWSLTNVESGVFIVLLIIGIILIVIGLRIAFQSVYFWTWKAYAVMFGIIAIIGIILAVTFL